ncbi:MAG: FG-GAP-like repeat-containing protein [Candidatus Sulfotelmatobacter sp.]
MPGKAPYSAAVGDFDRDGKLDMAVVSYLPTGTVSVLLGKGDGTFRLGQTYNVGVQPFFVAAASLRRNGILDLAVTDSLSNNVFVMLGNGDGTFQAAVGYPANGISYTIATGDFTGDGVPDLIAITGHPCDCISVFPGNGDGTFRAAVTTPLPYNVGGLALAAGFFEDDKKLDIAVNGQFGTANQVSILLGNGDGTFRPNGFYELVITPNSIVAGSFRGGHKTDLAVGVDPGVEVLLGNGDGTFQQPVLYAANFPTSVVAKDFSGDGILDLAVSIPGVGFGYPPGASVFQGNGDGTFQPAIFYPAGRDPKFIVAGDFNNDGKADVVTVDDVAGGVIALLNTGVVALSPTTPLKFDKQATGTTSAPRTVTLTNTGQRALTISSMKVTAQFGVTSTCNARVAPGANCTISVTFSPKTTGAKSGTVTIQDSTSYQPQVINLSGTGT